MVIPRTTHEIKKHPELSAQKNVLIWQRKSQRPFSELIVSWNASRPKKGHFSFYAKVRHHNWSPWKKLAEWGAKHQKTFGNTRNRYVHSKHVRLELQRGRTGHEYQIKVVAEKGADLRRIKALFANVANERDFSVQFQCPPLSKTCINNIPRQSQWKLRHWRTKDLCSPTSISMITRYFINKDNLFCPSFSLSQHAAAFAQKVHDASLNIYGNWIFNVAQAYSSTKGNILYRVERLNNFKELHAHLLKKIPVAVSLRGRLRGRHRERGAWPYNNGHFVVVIGWDPKKRHVLCLDPAFRNNKQMFRSYRIREFVRTWGRSRNLSYVPIPKKKFLSRNDLVAKNL